MEIQDVRTSKLFMLKNKHRCVFSNEFSKKIIHWNEIVYLHILVCNFTDLRACLISGDSYLNSNVAITNSSVNLIKISCVLQTLCFSVKLEINSCPFLKKLRVVMFVLNPESLSTFWSLGDISITMQYCWALRDDATKSYSEQIFLNVQRRKSLN